MRVIEIAPVAAAAAAVRRAHGAGRAGDALPATTTAQALHAPRGYIDGVLLVDETLAAISAAVRSRLLAHVAAAQPDVAAGPRAPRRAARARRRAWRSAAAGAAAARATDGRRGDASAAAALPGCVLDRHRALQHRRRAHRPAPGHRAAGPSGFVDIPLDLRRSRGAGGARLHHHRDAGHRLGALRRRRAASSPCTCSTWSTRRPGSRIIKDRYERRLMEIFE